ncbi:hypothetical protein BKA70DRAFT_1447599 [Coprinopsis sp. MPI-PUGE-AT-0042]|nr:hypothetical protein BKA70DRAFT_1447599 [Coprinopsis sp. MPI-PUGE-AT-0042]
MASFATKLFLVGVAIYSGFIASAGALPAEATVLPEIIPGPGLPSLASLNLTSADLYKPIDRDTIKAHYASLGLPTTVSGLQKRGECFPVSTRGDVNFAMACHNYLFQQQQTSMGTFTAYNPGTTLCSASNVRISGWCNPGGPCPRYSWAVHIAHAVWWSIEHCNYNGNVGGVETAYGNGDFYVRTANY